MSIFKPIVFALVAGGWAWVVSTLDKDLEYFYLKRFMWNGIQMAAGIAAFGLWLIVPVFWLGLPAALLILVGTFVGYVAYRNHNVPPDQQWSLSMETFTRRIDAMQAAQAQKRATVTLLTADEAPIEVPSGDNPQAKGHRALEQVLDYALRRGADRIKLVTDASKAKMSVRIDGVHYPQDEIEAGVAIALMDYLKGHGGLDLAERRKKQSGMLKIDAGDLERHQLELLSSGSTRGLNLTIVIDPHQRVSVAFKQLGLLESQRQQLEPLLEQPGHMVLVSCPPEQGQTTTLYSLVQKHDPYIQGVNTLEDTVA
ncbi:MAG: ATPase, T2SS/T4P/T4SS family, partial [Phycisphaeraceae bacterium]